MKVRSRKINIGAITNPGEIPKRANEIKAKGVEERQKIIDSQVDLITKDSNSKIQGQDTELSKALEAENIKFKAITDGQKI
jgi:hypothetical protein